MIWMDIGLAVLACLILWIVIGEFLWAREKRKWNS